MMTTTHCYANPSRRILGVCAFGEEHRTDIDRWNAAEEKAYMKNGDIHSFIVTPLSANIDVLDKASGELDLCDLRCWIIELRTRLENIVVHARAVEDVFTEEGDRRNV